jgi:ribosomal protein L27
MGRDHTLYAGAAGRVAFAVKGTKGRRLVSVLAD